MKQYSKKQITEAIAYWKNQLKQMNESITWPAHDKEYDEMSESPYYDTMTWGKFKAKVDRLLKDDDSVNIQVLCNGQPIRGGYGEEACFVDKVIGEDGDPILAINFVGS